METSPDDLEPVELLCMRHPELPYGARIIWLLCLAELRRSGHLPKIDDLAAFLGLNRRTVGQHLTNLYACGELTRGAYLYLHTIPEPLRLAEAMPYHVEAVA